ncbi:MAG: glycosyltransferase family 2 protein, partial [Candidatus Thermoplasmatota archaeon]
VAFIDGDAVADQDWFIRIKQLFNENNGKIAGVGGPDLLPEDSSFKEKTIGKAMTSPLARGGHFNPSTQHSLMDEKKYVDHIPTCNLCLKKKIFDKIGLFDEDFVKGQDLELNHRIRKKGYKLLYSPNVKVVHYRRNSIRSFARQIFKWAKAKVAITKKHGFQGLLTHIYFWPIYSIIVLLGALFLFYFFNLLEVFAFLFCLGALLYFVILFFESFRLSKRYKTWKLMPYFLVLLTVVFWCLFCFVKKGCLVKKRCVC